ncbi:MAG TPA: ROK family protein [Planctomycetaceae bacterium]|nr:ROK family protein [Planctomycetaceae bacterium]HIQ23222.1 ROK family protein [Planctomycetota bacterium]
MYLGIEIGGTKLQLGVGVGDGGPLVQLERFAVRAEEKAAGIRQRIEAAGQALIERYGVKAVGVGFGGPVDVRRGRTITSHQIAGWDDFPLADWCRRVLGRPVVVANDSDSAGLAEARFGAGRGHRVIFYNNVGSGIGGALVIEGQLYRGGSGVASELGHLRPGLAATGPDQTVESIASGWAITAAARSRLSETVSHPFQALSEAGTPAEPEQIRQRLIDREELEERDAADLLERCSGSVERLSTPIIAQAALAGNRLAREIFARATEALGWAQAQMITLLAPDVVVLGGGVSLTPAELWIEPLRRAVEQYVFPPLSGTYRIVPAALGEQVVVHGALALAADLHAAAGP